MDKKVLVCGFYFKNNIGDNLFIDAFKTIFPNYSFTFTDKITTKLLKEVSIVFFGGGSFLYAQPNIEHGALELLHTKSIFYIGVGAETDISPGHVDLLGRAKLVAIRSEANLELVKSINPNTIVIPDIIYSLQSQVKISSKIDKSVLVMSNISVVPQWADEHWKHVAWEHFKFEFAQFLDYLIEQKYSIKFFSMCQNNRMNDDWATFEIISQMKKRNNYNTPHNLNSVGSITSLISKYSVVITQRFHGAILSDMCQTPCLTISHHDKLKNVKSGKSISYYGAEKNSLISRFEETISEDILPKNSYIFNELSIKVNKIIDNE